MKDSPCCGQLTQRRDSTENLPANPSIMNGVEMIYLGAGQRQIIGSKSGLTYHVSDHRRRFQANRDDVRALAEIKDLILSP